VTKTGGSSIQSQAEEQRGAAAVGDAGHPAGTASSAPGQGVAATASPGVTVTARGWRRRWWAALLPLLLAALFVSGVLAWQLTRPPAYTAEALVAVLPEDPAVDVSLPITSVWAEIGNSDVVRDQISTQLGIGRSALDDGLEVEASSDAPLIFLRASTDSADTSAQWANTAAAALLGQSTDNPVPGHRLQQVAAAQAPQAVDPSVTPLLVAGGAVLGLLVGAAVAQLLQARDRRRSAGS
jgi:capsular polysaccharide biosynthesis protein